MQSLFDDSARRSILERFSRLEAGSQRRWGKMDVAQMVTHCSRALETVTGDRPSKQALLGRLLTPFIRRQVFGDRPFSKGAPTDPSFVVSDARDLETERRRLEGLVEKLCRQGPDEAARHPHVFFGELSGEEWGVLMYKHLDHHLHQFGV